MTNNIHNLSAIPRPERAITRTVSMTDSDWNEIKKAARAFGNGNISEWLRWSSEQMVKILTGDHEVDDGKLEWGA